jgi:hypothetical protein
VSTAVVAREDATEQQKRIRRSALLYGGIALAFYLGFIVMAVVRALR